MGGTRPVSDHHREYPHLYGVVVNPATLVFVVKPADYSTDNCSAGLGAGCNVDTVYLYAINADQRVANESLILYQFAQGRDGPA